VKLKILGTITPILPTKREKAWQSNCSGQINLKTIHCAKLTHPNVHHYMNCEENFCVNISSPLQHKQLRKKKRKKNLFFS